MGGGYKWFSVHFFFIIQKTWKSTWPILKSNSTSFWFKKFFLGWIIKILWKGGALLQFLYEVGIVVLIDFIAILLTPGIFLIQIVNTNVYLFHFHRKNNIQMHFNRSWVLKVSKQSHSFIIHCNAVKQIALTSAKTSQQCIVVWFSKKIYLVNNYYIYIYS